MPQSKWKTWHCHNIAKKRRKIVNILNSDDDESTDEEIERVDNQIENEAEQFFSILMKNMEILKFSKRPLVNLGNSRITKYKWKIKALENQKKMDKHLFNYYLKKNLKKHQIARRYKIIMKISIKKMQINLWNM